ncbi:hypothetical protein PSI22_20460 [Xenorhabdus sp. XENO-7]|uniref:DUF2345 domain-containing protein n=1 Tax=Xenorhabdus aichiensis TaxID=3025874 RepID=A0ABT5M8B3_9GAMM|nr:hypothetical protein [Xenorhabdus aichiensis]MDC9623943.1 hypothetical protein [Xenorhabdus aichiensis]
MTKIWAGGTDIIAGDRLQLSAGQDIVGSIIKLISTEGDISVNAGRDLIFLARRFVTEPSQDKRLYTSGISTFNAAKNLILSAAGNLSTYATNLVSGRDMAISTGGNIRFESLKEYVVENKTEQATQRASQLRSGGALTIQS